jgi:hypothetical protein
MLNKYSIGLILLVSALASLMEVNALECYKALNVPLSSVEVFQEYGTGSPKDGTCLALQDMKVETCSSDEGCYIYRNKIGSVDFGCGIKAKCDAKKNCCEGDLCNCSD